MLHGETSMQCRRGESLPKGIEAAEHCRTIVKPTVPRQIDRKSQKQSETISQTHKNDDISNTYQQIITKNNK